MKYLFLWLSVIVVFIIFTPWWVTLGFIFASGTIYSMTFETRGDYDFFTPIIGLGVFLMTLIGTVSFLIGKFLF